MAYELFFNELKYAYCALKVALKMTIKEKYNAKFLKILHLIKQL